MLMKLVKYDLKWTMKVILVFISLGFIFSVLGRLFSLIEDSLFFSIVTAIFKGAGLSMFITALFNSVIRGWVRFVLNLYKDESYLTHTLPINKSTLYLAKVLSVIISIIITCVALLIGVVIMYYSKENLEVVKESLNAISTILDSSVIGFLLLCFFIVLLEAIFIVLCGYFGIVVGHMFNKKKMLMSVLFGLGVYFAATMISFLIMLVSSLFNEGVYGIIFGGTTNIEFSMLVVILWIFVVLYSLYNLALYFIGNKLFNKGVNVE